MAKVINPILFPEGQDNMGGYKPFILFIPSSSVTAVPKLNALDAAEGSSIEATGAFTFKAGLKPIYVQCTDKTVKFAGENQGEVEAQSFKHSGEFFRAGALKSAGEFSRMVNNTSGYIILEDMDGNQIMVGAEGLPCYVKPSFDGGMARTDRRGFKFTFEADSLAPIVFLKAPIDVDGLLNPIPAVE